MNPITESSMVNGTLVEGRAVEVPRSIVDQRHIERRGAKKSVMRRLVKTLILVAVLIGGGVFGLYKMRVDIPPLNTPKIYAHMDSMGERTAHLKERVVAKYESYFGKHEEEAHHEEHQIVVTSPMAKDVVITQEYVCQIRSRRHIDVCALESGYLKAIPIREGQAVKEGDVMFESCRSSTRQGGKPRWPREISRNWSWITSMTLFKKNGISAKEVALYKAKLAKAQAKLDLAQAELNFAKIKAPFDGIVDRLKDFQGSLVKEGDVLTTLSDNSVMWVYFNVTEKRYLEYMADTDHNKQSIDVVLMLANHSKFPEIGKIDQAHNIGAIEANFNNETGNIAFRADFPNPKGLLRHGQTGTVLIDRTLKDAIVIPQRSAFENLAKRYVYVVGKDDIVQQREIVIEHELEDIFVISKGLEGNEKIILEGIRQVRDGEKVEFEFRQPELVMANQKNKAE